LLLARHTELNKLSVALGRAGETLLLRRRSRWERLHTNLQALSPKEILARGYALVFDAEGRLVKEASALKAGELVRTQLGEGEFTSKVGEVRPSNNK
jgi:exodeoxyribonuclease VII large subunit